MERKFHGSESSLYGLFAPGNESAEERKGLESIVIGAYQVSKFASFPLKASEIRQLLRVRLRFKLIQLG